MENNRKTRKLLSMDVVTRNCGKPRRRRPAYVTFGKESEDQYSPLPITQATTIAGSPSTRLELNWITLTDYCATASQYFPNEVILHDLSTIEPPCTIGSYLNLDWSSFSRLCTAIAIWTGLTHDWRTVEARLSTFNARLTHGWSTVEARLKPD